MYGLGLIVHEQHRVCQCGRCEVGSIYWACRGIDAERRTALALWQVEHLSLCGGKHLQCPPTDHDPLATCLYQAIECLVVVPGFMVKECQPLDLRRKCDIHHILDRAMSPPEPLLVFCHAVLRVVDDEVCPGQERDVPLLLTMREPAWGLLARQSDAARPRCRRGNRVVDMARFRDVRPLARLCRRRAVRPFPGPASNCRLIGHMGFVVSSIDHGHAARLEPIAEGERRMVQITGGNAQPADAEGT